MKYLAESGANVVAIISDVNRVNKKFLKCSILSQMLHG